MNETLKWPILHILVGVPIILAIAALGGAALEGWSMSKAAVLHGAAITTPVGMAYTFIITAIERSYYMVFWAKEKTRQMLNQAKADSEAREYAKWRAWYDRQQAAFREGRPFDEPPPPPPENRNGS